MSNTTCDHSIVSHHQIAGRRGPSFRLEHGLWRKRARGVAKVAAVSVLLSACAQPLSEEEQAALVGTSASPDNRVETGGLQPSEPQTPSDAENETPRSGEGVPTELDSMGESVGQAEPDPTSQNAGAVGRGEGDSSAPAMTGEPSTNEQSTSEEPPPQDGEPGDSTNSSQTPGQPLPEAPPPGEPPLMPAPRPPGVPVDCGDPAFLVCDSFEDAVVGEFPDDEQWLEELMGCGSHTVDDQVLAQSGQRALRATGAAYPECMLHADVSLEPELFVRTYVRLTEPSSESGNHVSLLELGALPSQDDPELRIGLRGSSACAEPGLDVTVGGLATGERTRCSGIELEADRWYCLEAHYRLGAENLEVEVHLDGQVAVAPTVFGELAESWQTGGLFLKLGRATYGGSNAFDVFHDDIAVARSRIGCD